jgi:hypothetical protein
MKVDIVNYITWKNRRGYFKIDHAVSLQRLAIFSIFWSFLSHFLSPLPSLSPFLPKSARRQIPPRVARGWPLLKSCWNWPRWTNSVNSVSDWSMPLKCCNKKQLVIERWFMVTPIGVRNPDSSNVKSCYWSPYFFLRFRLWNEKTLIN